MTTATALAAMNVTLETIAKSTRDIASSQKELNAAVVLIDKKTESMDMRLQSLEKRFEKADVQLDEFVAIKHKVNGAGMAGKMFWGIGLAIISGVFYLVQQFNSIGK